MKKSHRFNHKYNNNNTQKKVRTNKAPNVFTVALEMLPIYFLRIVKSHLNERKRERESDNKYCHRFFLGNF